MKEFRKRKRSFCIIWFVYNSRTCKFPYFKTNFTLCSPENEAEWPKRDYKKGKETFKGLMDLPRLWLKKITVLIVLTTESHLLIVLGTRNKRSWYWWLAFSLSQSSWLEVIDSLCPWLIPLCSFVLLVSLIMIKSHVGLGTIMIWYQSN